MQEQELERRLRTAMDHAAPDPLERILASCGEQGQGHVIDLTECRKPRRRWTSLAVAAVLAVMCCAFGLTSWRSSVNAVASVVSLDVNPSIQLQVNKNEKVLSAQALNEDAVVILDGMDLTGTQLKVAVNAIVGSLLQHGYLDRLSSAILISVEDDDAQRAARLESDLTAEVGTALQNASAGAAILSQTLSVDADLEAQAQSSNISVGKAAMIRDVQALNDQLDFDALCALSVEELEQLRESGAPAMPIGKDAAAAAAAAYAGLSLDDVDYDVDPELDEDPAHYEVELSTAYGEFDYDVDAWTGAILKGTADVTAPSTSSASTSTSGSSASSSTGTPSESSGSTASSSATSSQITAAQAKTIALADAGVSESDALGLKVKQEREDGVAIYEVEFRAAGVEYEYEIRASDGAILKRERDGDEHAHNSSSSSSSSGGTLIGESAAKAAALADAGVSSSEIRKMECELDKDDGSYVYEVEFRTANRKYEYKIDAYTGVILKSEWD